MLAVARCGATPVRLVSARRSQTSVNSTCCATQRTDQCCPHFASCICPSGGTLPPEVATANPMTRLYQRLSDFGLPRKYVRDVALPSWWDDAAATNPAGYAQALVVLSRHAGLELSSLRDDSATIRLNESVPHKFKKVRTASADDVGVARALATQVAKIVALGVQRSSVKVPSAAEVRQAVLDSDRRWVDLDGLLDYCWGCGVPVVHVSAFPRGAKKMDGIAARVNGIPVIVVSKEAKFSSWLLFIVAHELGHIACGHVEENQALVDDNVDVDSIDTEEVQANAFALELITGKPNTKIRLAPNQQWPNADSLAKTAQRYGQQSRTDPGHVVLNYAHSMGTKFWPVAQAALKKLEPRGSATELIRAKMAGRLNWEEIPEDESEFVMRMTGVDGGDSDADTVS